jgi:hypothetical protein
MSGELKLLFDECCSRRLPVELRQFYAIDYPGIEFRHLMQDWAPGTPDFDWLAPLREDRSWIVITKDAGKNSSMEKLPIICRGWGITHVTFTASIIDAGFTEQKNALVGIWRQLFYLGQLPAGTQVKLGYSQGRGGFRGFELRVGGKSVSSILKLDD